MPVKKLETEQQSKGKQKEIIKIKLELNKLENLKKSNDW